MWGGAAPGGRAGALGPGGRRPVHALESLNPFLLSSLLRFGNFAPSSELVVSDVSQNTPSEAMPVGPLLLLISGLGLTLQRRAFVAATTAATLSNTITTPANAGYVTSLGIETTQPKDAEKDSELLATKQVQDAISALKSYKANAARLAETFAADQNMPLIPTIRKDFDFSQLRDSLNTATAVFDDQTQLTMDRMARGVLYDFTELENASRLKKGEETRTSKKIANVEKWFGKIDSDLTELLAYY